MADSNMKVSITRRTFIKGVGLLSASAALAACSPMPGTGGQSASSAAQSASASASGQSASSAAQSASASGQSSSAQQAPTPLLAIVYTNDTHGHDVAVEGTDDVAGNFSMAATAALKAEWEQKGYDVLLVDGGDATQGTPLVDNTYGAPAIAFMNACGYDLMTVGNHEFDWGTDALASNENAANFPFMSANVLDKETNKLRFVPNKIVDLTSGIKVGLFGLTTPSTITTARPAYVSKYTFLNGEELYKCAQEQVDELRAQGCDIVICVGHLGNRELDGSTSTDLLNNVKGIDLFLDGHDHEEMQSEVAGTLLIESGCYMRNMGVVVIDEGAPTAEMIAAGTYDGIDQSAQAIIDSENERVQSELNVVLGTTPYFLNGERAPGVRTQETNLGNFCADAFRWAASVELGKEVDAGIINAGSVRVSIDEGDITLGTIKSVMPFANDLSVINITGAQMLEALEAATQAVGREKAIGAFPQVAGIEFTVDATVPFEEGPIYPDSTYPSPASPGARVTITDVAGRGFSLEETYSVATCSFLCQGGDTYYVFKEASDVETPVAFGFDYEALVSYLTEACNHEVPAEYADTQGRITIIMP